MFSDHGERIEFGDTGLIQEPDGSYYDRYTKERTMPDGKVFGADGQLIYDPDEEEEATE